MQPTVIVIAEHSVNRINPITYELIAFAKMLRKKESLAIKIFILGDHVAEIAQQIADASGLEVTAVLIPELSTYNAEIYVSTLTALLTEFEAAYICVPHTSQGMDFAPALAVKLKAACITAVEDILEVKGRVCFARSIYGGKAVVHIRPQSEISILTVQSGLFRPQHAETAAAGRVRVKSIQNKSKRTRSTGIKQAAADTATITEAKVIVAAGQGIGTKDNLDLIYQLASLFTKSAVAGSRIVCDLGWLEYSCQVGVTGAIVSPQLYIACGISGAAQHISGMRGSDFIVAINKDPSAAIFQAADICIIEDLTRFIPALIKAYKDNEHQS